MKIDSTSWTSPNYDERPGPITALCIHSCEGAPANHERASSLPWLCKPQSQVSCHYYITRKGIVYQLVADWHRAWHAGVSALEGVGDVNDFSIGIELEHRKGSNPYPAAQMSALYDLCQAKMREYGIPHSRVVSHRAVALPQGRKIDPSNFSEAAFRAWVNTISIGPYTADSPILGTPHGDLAYILPRVVSSYYTPFDVGVILGAYWTQAQAVGVDPVLAIAQMCHETGYEGKPLSSFWSHRPQRNGCGLGVSGQVRYNQPATPGWAFNYQRNRWELGLSFETWARHSIPAHIGRLLAYALTDSDATDNQYALIQQALEVRLLPVHVRGSAQTIKQLGQVHNPSGHGWASPGAGYGLAIASHANRLVLP